MRDPLNNKLFGATLLSGALSGITLSVVPGALFVGPGILFGLATAWVLYTVNKQDIIQGFIWIASSAAAWYIAMRMYTSAGVYQFTFSNNGQLTNMILAGLVGSLILAVVFSLLVRVVSLKNILVTVISGVVLAAVMYLILASGTTIYPNGNGSSESLPQLRLALAFTVWQVGVGFSLLAYKPKPLITKPRKPATTRLGLPYLIVVIVAILLISVPYAVSKVSAQINHQDIQTTKDLNVIAAAVDDYDLGSTSLPSGIDKLDFSQTWAGDTGSRVADYTYKITGFNTYQLCATFKNASTTTIERVTPHPKGYSCFNFQDPRLRPVD